jgi:hypothetical protein
MSEEDEIMLREEEFWPRRNEHDRKVEAERGEQIEAYLAEAKAEALRIDPETAEVTFWWSDYDDPYGVYGRPIELCACVGREYFARNPDSDIWVWFDYLPEETLEKLKHRRKPSFTITPDDDAIWNGIDTPI